MKITCNPKEAADAMEQRYYRFEALTCHIWGGIQNGIKAHNVHEQGHGFLPAAPEEISMSLMNAVVSHFRHDAVAVERFITVSMTISISWSKSDD
jgi:hypothetical protein